MSDSDSSEPTPAPGSAPGERVAKPAAESDSDEIIRHRRGRGGRSGAFVLIALVVVAVVVLAGAYASGLLSFKSPGVGSCPPPNEVLNGAGSTLVAPLMFQWSTTYSTSSVNYDSIGSGAGILQIQAKTVDFGASDAPLSPTQRSVTPSPGVLTIPESVGGVVPIYNLPGVTQTLNFTGQVLASIYLGDITNWNDPAIAQINPGVNLPNAPIVVVWRVDGSGTTFIWTSYLSAENATWRSNYGFATSILWPVGIGERGNAAVTQAVKSTADAIGYVDINYALTESLAYGAVKNPAGHFIHATLPSISSALNDSNVTLPPAAGDWYNVSLENAPGASDYPIVSLTYLFVYKDLGTAYGSSYSIAKAENLVDFLSWVVSATGGQRFAAPLYYLPLTPATTASDLTAINSITYNGAAIPPCSTR